ncbi:MAG: DUF5995 family protein [Actinomycetota bacterium]
MRRRLTHLHKALVLGLLAVLSTSGMALADHPDASLPWPDLLPARPVPPQSSPDTRCTDPPAPACIDQVISRMYEAWRPLDEACHPRAVFALAYLRTTEAFRESLGRGLFQDEAWMIDLGRLFADFFFEATHRYPAGHAPPAWKVAFEAADAGRTNGGQDFLAGMNAHIQRDLPVVLYRMGLVSSAGSQKPDHDRVNRILESVFDSIEEELAARYDPVFALADAHPSPLDEMSVLEMIKAWREGAWRNAERLGVAASESELHLTMESIEAGAEAWGRLITLPDNSAYAAFRSGYCRSARSRDMVEEPAAPPSRISGTATWPTWRPFASAALPSSSLPTSTMGLGPDRGGACASLGFSD